MAVGSGADVAAEARRRRDALQSVERHHFGVSGVCRCLLLGLMVFVFG